MASAPFRAAQGMTSPNPPTAASHLAQVSVEAVKPQVVGDLMVAFRHELAALLPGLLAPLVQELKDLKKQTRSAMEKAQAIALEKAQAHEKICTAPAAGAPVAATSGAEAAVCPLDQTITASSNSGAEAGCINYGYQDAKAGGQAVKAKQSVPRIDSLPQRMDIEMSTPLVDPFKPPRVSSLRWSWNRLSGRRSNSAREGYHLTPRCDPDDRDAEADRRSTQLPFERLVSTSGLTFGEKLRIAQDSMRAGKDDQSWISQQVSKFFEDPESSAAAHWYNQFIIFFSIFSIWVGLFPFVGIAIPLSFQVGIDSVLFVETLTRVLFCHHFHLFISDPANLIDSMSSLPITVIILMHAGVYEKDVGDSFYLSAVPVIRFLRFVRRFPKMQILITAFKDCLEALPVLLYTLAVMGVIFTSAIYLVEPRDNVESLSESAWLVITTISTVGYGDVTPCTRFGAALASVLMVVSQLYMAMPFGIIGYNFTAIWERRAQILLLNGTRDRLAKWGFGAWEIPRLFELFDLDESAEFDMQEFQLLFKEMDIGFKEDDVFELFKLIDKDAGGTIDEKEFVKTVYPQEYRFMYAKSKKSVRNTELKDALLLDEDGTCDRPGRQSMARQSMAMGRKSTMG